MNKNNVMSIDGEKSFDKLMINTLNKPGLDRNSSSW